MKNSILRELFKRLASAPETVANDYLNELSEQDRTDAERLLRALNIKIRYTSKDNFILKDGFAIAAETDAEKAKAQAQKLNLSDALEDALCAAGITGD